MSSEEHATGEKAIGLAQHWLSLHRPERCLEELDRGASPEDPATHALRAAAFLQLERPREALRSAEDGLALDAENPGLLRLLGNAHWDLHHRSDAEKAFLRALAIDPDDATLLARYALLVAEAGQIEKAEALLQEAAAIDPERRAVLRAQSVVAFIAGKDRDAERLGRELLADEPEDAAAHALVGTYSASSGRSAKAAAHFRTAAGLEPTDRELVGAAREISALRHPLLRPMLWLDRFGPGKIWLGAIALIFGLRAIGLETASSIAAITYLVIVVYSWIAGAVVRKKFGDGS